MKTTTINVDYLPAELLEQILLNLLVKSLIRFSTISKSWNSIIIHPKFKKSYRGREVIVSCQRDYLACPLSSMSTGNPSDETTSFGCPFDFRPALFLASCGNLWSFKFVKSLLLYNPSVQTYRKLPYPESVLRFAYDNIYGLGYDSVCDDYKILQIKKPLYFGENVRIDMYSLTSDCWRIIESRSPVSGCSSSSKCLFVSGALHWLISRVLLYDNGGGEVIANESIISFDLSEGKFGRIELPELPKKRSRLLDIAVFGGKLRVYLHGFHFSVWVMEDYKSKLWTKEMEFEYPHITKITHTCFRPFYFYDGVGNLVRAVTSSDTKKETMFIYKDGGSSSSSTQPLTLVEKNFGSNYFNLNDSLTYVESLALFPL